MKEIVATVGSFRKLTCAMHYIVWGETHFCLWCVLENRDFTVFCYSPTHLQPDYSLARRGLPQRQAFSREPQLDPHSLLYRLMKQPEMSSLNSMCDCRHSRVLQKIDMRNALHSLRRDSFLSVVRVRKPGLYSLLLQSYSSPTRLFFGEEGFASETGIQQGAPIGPALFALSVDEAARDVQSEFNVWYLDDVMTLPSETPQKGFTPI